jgi:hypothetical protein
MLSLFELVEDNHGRNLFNYEDFATDYSLAYDMNLPYGFPSNKFVANPLNQASTLTSVFHSNMLSVLTSSDADVAGQWKFKVAACVQTSGYLFMVEYDGLLCEE